MTTVTLPRAGIPLIGPDGRVTSEWFRFFHDITQRVGGVAGASADDLALSQFGDAGIEELKQALYRSSNEFGQAPAMQPILSSDDIQAELSALRDLLAEQGKAIEALNQGTTL